MTVSTVPIYDATGEHCGQLPAAAQVAGYVTGTGAVPWTAAQLAARPGVMLIDQSPADTAADELADMADYENGAVTLADLPGWVKAARANYLAGRRPGQRDPGVYCSASNVTAVVNALIAGGVTGCPLGVADYSTSAAAAAAAVADAGGPFPIVWYQYADTGGGGTYDLGVASAAWLGAVSEPPPAVPPGQWNDASGWTWKQVTIGGVGLDGQLHLFGLTPAGDWQRLS